MTDLADLPIVPLSVIDAEIERRRLKRSLHAFAVAAWPLVEPTHSFVDNWHLQTLCQVLQDVTSGQLPRLIVNVPPGTMKSLLVSVFWPAWEWANAPSLRWLTASYGGHLSVRDNLRLRSIITSPWYQRLFPELRLAGDQNAKERFNTTAEGWRIATSVGGVGTGEHPDRVVIDDPTSASQARSLVELQTARDWFDRTVSTRGVTRDTRIVIIMQRLHEQDLSGHLLSRGGWEHVCWPMRYDASRPDPRDQRTIGGELLWPALFPEAKVRQLELDLGPFGSAGQLQQRPAPEGGGLFKAEWFQDRFVDASPSIVDRRVRGWDTAATEGAGDYTVGVRMSYAGGLVYVEDVVRGQWAPGGVDAQISITAQMDGRECMQREEREGGSAGKAVVASRSKSLFGYDYAAVNVSKDKVTRAGAFRAQCEAGNVRIVRGAWNEAYLRELYAFPMAGHDDQVDASSCCLNALAIFGTTPSITPPPIEVTHTSLWYGPEGSGGNPALSGANWD